MQTCSRCQIVFYCSAACQKVHWKQGGHHKVCKPKPPSLLEQWAAADPHPMITAEGKTASSWMESMGLSNEELADSGIAVGDWPRLFDMITESTLHFDDE